MREAAVKDKMVQIWISETTGVQPITTLACNLSGFHKLNRVGLSTLSEKKKKIIGRSMWYLCLSWY